VVFRVTLLPLRHAELVSASHYLVMLNSIQHLKNETLKQVQGDVKMVFRVTLLPLRHAELDSASYYPVMLNLFQHLKNGTLK
jgi:hypothetical protein